MKTPIYNIQPWLSKFILSRGSDTNLLNPKNTKWNPESWCADVDFSSMSICNDKFSRLRAGTLIGKQHTICAYHYQLPVGTQLSWLTRDNKIVKRKVSAAINHPFAKVSFGFADLTILELDAPVTEVTPAPILHPAVLNVPKNVRTFSGEGRGFKWTNRILLDWSVVVTTQDKHATIKDLAQITALQYSSTSSYFAIAGLPRIIEIRNKFESARSGDSGCPWYILTPHPNVERPAKIVPALVGLTRALSEANWLPDMFDWVKSIVPDAKQTDPYTPLISSLSSQ